MRVCEMHMASGTLSRFDKSGLLFRSGDERDANRRLAPIVDIILAKEPDKKLFLFYRPMRIVVSAHRKLPECRKRRMME